mgnify:CR=1 FL=1
MEKQIKMPKLRPEMESGVVCAWLKEEGQQVLAGEQPRHGDGLPKEVVDNGVNLII